MNPRPKKKPSTQTAPTSALVVSRLGRRRIDIVRDLLLEQLNREEDKKEALEKKREPDE
jgi:hypothetical protein